MRFPRVGLRPILLLVSIFGFVAIPIVAGPAAAVPAPPGAVVGDPTPVSSPQLSALTANPAVGQALQQAKVTGQSTPIPSLLTPTKSTVANPNGSLTTTTAAGPVRVDTASGWVPINTNLVSDSTGVHPQAVADTLTLSPGGTGPLVTLAETSATSAGTNSAAAPGTSLTFGAPNSLPAPTLSGDTATYAGAVDGGDLVVTAHPTGFEFSLVFQSAPTAPVVLDVPLSTQGAQVSQLPDGGLQLKNPAGAVIGESPAPQMFDASLIPNTDMPMRTLPIATSLVSTPNGQALELRPDQNWLTSPSTQYPVTIDPTGSLGDVLDTWVNDAAPTTNYDGGSDLDVGNYGFGPTAITRSFIQFQNAVIKNTNVTSAVLDLYEHNSGSCAPTPMDVQGAKLLGLGTMWTTQPVADGINWSSTSFYGGNSACSSTAGFRSLDITMLAQSWSHNGYPSPEDLTMIAPNEQDSTQFKQFYSGNTFLPPTIAVTYYVTPNTPTNISPTNGSTVTSLTPTLSGTLSGYGGDGIAGYFYVSNSAGTQVASGTSAYVSSTTNVSYQVPAGALLPSQTYTWRMYDCVGIYPTLFCSTPTVQTFITPSGAPTAPNPPAGVAATAGNTTASVTWTASTTNGSPVTGYTVTSNPGNVSVTSTTTSATVTTLTNGTSYTFTVVADSAAGNSAPSAASNAVTPEPPPTTRCYSADHCWGVDSASAVTSTFLSQVQSADGNPDFWGRYLTIAPGNGVALASSEFPVLHGNGSGILLIAANFGSNDVAETGAPGTQDGAAVADAAAQAAGALNIPANGTIAIFADIEYNWTPTTNWLSGYADEITHDGYLPGFYGSPVNPFGPAFCAATSDPTVASSTVWSQNVSQTGTTPEAQSPAFAPTGTGCAGGSTLFWQYRLAGSSVPNVDEDEMASGHSSLLYYP